MEGESSDTEEDYHEPDEINNEDTVPDLREIPQSKDELDKETEEQLDLTDIPQTVDDVEKAIRESDEQLDLSEIPQTVDDVEKTIKESEEHFDLSEIPQTIDDVEKSVKENEERLDLNEIPQTVDEVERAINEEQLDLSKVPNSMDELNKLEDYQNKNIVKNSITKLMRMSPEQRESLGLPREYTSHELDTFFKQINPPSTLDNNKATPSKVSNPESSEPISRNDLSDETSKDLKKESENITKEKAKTSESDIKQKETSSTLNKDIKKGSNDNSKSELANIDWQGQYLQKKKGMEEASNEKSEFDINNLELIENMLYSKRIKLATTNDKIKSNNLDEEILKKEIDNIEKNEIYSQETAEYNNVDKETNTDSKDVNSIDLKEQENLKEEKKEQEKLKEKIEDLNNENSKDKSNRDVPQEWRNQQKKINDMLMEPNESHLNVEERLDENIFEKTLLHPQLKLLYKEFNEDFENNRRKQKANHGIFLRPAFREFVKNHENLTFDEKEELDKIINQINSNKIIEKYILNQLKNTIFTENKIAKMDEIKGLRMVPDSVRRIVKENKLNSREKLNFTHINIDLTKQVDNLNENSFNNTLLYPKLVDLYRKYYKDEILNHKKYTANFGFFLRPAFKDFVKNQDNLKPSIKDDLINRINVINSERWIEKYILYQLKTTSKTTYRIANIENIKGLSLRINAVKKKEKGYGLESREVIWKKNRLYDHFKKGTYLEVCKKIIDEARSKINADRKTKNIELIKSNEAPTTKELINFNYEDLVCVVYNLGLSYNYDILKQLGYELNHISSISDEKVKDIKDTIRSKNLFTLKDMAKKHEVAISTIKRIAIKELGKEKFKLNFSQDLPAEKGIITHNLIKNHITKVFDKRRKYSPDVPKIISEPKIYFESQKCTDLGFQNINHNKINYLQRLLTKTEQRNFLSQKLNIKLKNLQGIKFVQFDFTSLLNENNFLNKIEKYQNYEVLTFIVGTYWYKDWDDGIIELPNNKLIKFPDNIKIISPNLFIDLLDLQGEDRDKFLEIINLNEMNEIEALREIFEKENINLHYTKDLENDLKKNGQIKESINEFLNNKKKKSNKKGLLDKFISKEYRD